MPQPHLWAVGMNWILSLVPWEAIGGLQTGRDVDLYFEKSLYLGNGPQWVGIEARGPGRRPSKRQETVVTCQLMGAMMKRVGMIWEIF